MSTYSPSPLVLIVDNESRIFQTLQPLLEQEGYAVAKADTGAEALDMSNRLRPHLILLDAVLPDQNGFEICAKLQALPDAILTPVVMIGGSVEDRQFADRAFAAGAVDAMCNPDESVQANWPLFIRRIRYLIRSRQAEEALAQERNQWRTLIDNLPDHMYIKDRQSHFMIVNAATAQFLGATTPAELIGKSDFDFHPQEFATRYFANEQALFESGQAVVNLEELGVDHSTGKLVWFLSTKVPVKDSQGKVIGLVGVGRDITERKQEEEAIARERALLRTLIDNVPDYIFVKDTAGRFLVSNLAHALAAGASSPEELVGKTAFDLFPAHLATRFHADDEAIMQSGQALINADRRTVDANGLERVVLTTKVPLKDRQGKVIGLVGISRDITEQRRAEDALLEERTLLRTLIDNIPDNIFVKDTQGRIIINNVAHRNLMGLASLEEAIGKADSDFFPQDLASKYFADEQAIIRSGQPLINYEEPVVDQSGNKLWFLTTKVPWHNSRGEITGIVGVNHDITERKQTEETLLKERTLLRILIDQIPDYIYVKDLQHRLLMTNVALANFVGAATPAEVVGKTDYDIMPPELAARFYASEQAVLESGEAVINLEEPPTDHLGNQHWVLTTKLPLRDPGGKIIGLVGVSRDITERKQAEEALIRSNDELEQFAYIASHDLQEPLRMVTSYVELLAERYEGRLDAEADEFIGYAVDGANRMHRLIEDLLTYSHAGVADRPVRPIPFRIAYLSALFNLDVVIKEIHAEITCDPLPTVMGDEIRLTAVFQNLFSNALKFHRELPPRIHVSVRQDAGMWLFGVKDNGIGIPPEHCEKIFEIFKRLHSRSKYPGTGIGLAVCKKIIEQHGGKIWAESQVGEGTTFYFTLPKVEVGS